MGDRTRATCRVCGRHRDEVGPISWTGKCAEDSHRAYHSAADQIHYHVGPEFDHWRRRMAASIGAVLVDDVLGDD